MLKLRRSLNRLIFNMGIYITWKGSLYVEMGPSGRLNIKVSSCQYWDSHIKDRLIFDMEISINGKSLYIEIGPWLLVFHEEGILLPAPSKVLRNDRKCRCVFVLSKINAISQWVGENPTCIIILSFWKKMTPKGFIQYIPRNMHTVFALLCFVVVIHWLIFPYPSGLLHWHCGNLTIAPVPAKHPWWIWINTSCEFIINDCITTTKQSTTKPCAYFLGYTVPSHHGWKWQFTWTGKYPLPVIFVTWMVLVKKFKWLCRIYMCMHVFIF